MKKTVCSTLVGLLLVLSGCGGARPHVAVTRAVVSLPQRAANKAVDATVSVAANAAKGAAKAAVRKTVKSPEIIIKAIDLVP